MRPARSTRDPSPVSAQVHALPLAAVTVLLMFSLWRRARRLIGRQPVRPKRMVLRLVLLCAVAAVVLPASIARFPPLADGVAIGVAVGFALALLSLRLTRFEFGPQGPTYIPNLYIGLGLSALFAARLVYRMILVYPQMQQAATGHTGVMNALPPSPLTFGLLGTLLSYYFVYYLGVLLRSRQLAPARM